MPKHSMVRVCHIVSGDTWGGLEVVVLNLMRAQVARMDTKPSLVLLNEGRFSRTARDEGIEVRIVPEAEMNIWELVRGVDRAISELEPTIIHAHRYKEQFLSYILAWRHGAKCISTIHGYEPPATLLGRIKFLIWDCINSVLARIARANFVAVTEDLRKRYRVSSSRCAIIPNGIPLHDSCEVREPFQRVDRSLGPVIGWIGRMVPVKGLPTLLKAVSQMSEAALPVRILLIGDGPERQNLEALADSLNIRRLIEFTGFVAEPRLLFSKMDIFVLPSIHEGVPIALLESLAAGVPVVAAAVGGIPQMIGNTGAALLIRSSSPEVWATALTSLIDCPEELNRMANKGSQLVREQFSIESMSNKYHDVYLSAIA